MQLYLNSALNTEQDVIREFLHMQSCIMFTFRMVMVKFDCRVVRDNSISHLVIDTGRHLPPLFLFFSFSLTALSHTLK